jgi:hypothetical protein
MVRRNKLSVDRPFPGLHHSRDRDRAGAITLLQARIVFPVDARISATSAPMRLAHILHRATAVQCVVPKVAMMLMSRGWYYG